MLFKKGSADAGAKSPASKTGGGEKTSSIPLPAAIGLLAVALVLLFFTVLRPMLFSEAPPPSSPAPEAGVEGVPGAPGVPPPPVSPGGNVGGPGAADSAAGQPAPAPPPPAPAAPAPGPAAPAGGGGATSPAPAVPGDVSLSPETGEILVKGTVTQVDGPKLKLRMSVTSVQLGGQPERALGAPRAKEVVLADNTDIVKGGQRVKLTDIKPGAAVWAIGPNLGEGQPLVARAVAAQ
jgi:hypothetical protein